jgi:branched-chain amino acid transport system permease protein
MIANLIIGGLAAGSLYALLGIAIAIVLRVTDVPNFAQGEMAMVSTFVAYELLHSYDLPMWLAVLATIVFAALQGLVVQLLVVRPLIGSPMLSTVIATLGVNIVLHSVAGMIWGHETHIFPSPLSDAPPLFVGGLPLPLDSVVNIVAALLVVIGFTLLLNHSWAGLALRATSQNQIVARLMGVSVSNSFALAWGLGGVAGALAGVLIAPAVFLDTNMMSSLLIKGFAGGVLGGFSSLTGVFLGGLALGVAENLVGAYLSGSFSDALTFLVIITVLVIRPEGVFGQLRTRKV